MKNIIGVCFLLLVGAAEAATVTIDFEEFAVGTEGPVTSYDYVVSGEGTPGYGCMSGPSYCGGPAEVVAGKAFRVAGAEDPFAGTYVGFDIVRQDGQAFAIYSLSGFSSGFQAITAGGDTIYGTLTDLGKGDWLNIISFNVSLSAPPSGGTILQGQIDNIVVGSASVVPVPAALWLFVSALAGLGFVRQRKNLAG